MSMVITGAAASRRVNIDAMYDLLDAAKASGSRPRVAHASSIAVFGDPLPTRPALRVTAILLH